MRLNVEIRINEGAGFQRPPVNLMCQANLPGQRNFEFDFEAPDVPTITDLRVSLPAQHPIRTALLFARHRFYAETAPQAAAKEAAPQEASAAGTPRGTPADIPRPPAREQQPAPQTPASSRPAPWDVPRRPDGPSAAEPRPPERYPEPRVDVPRRKRLE
jgi:hypothetical protein